MQRDKRKQQVRRGSLELPHPKCVYCGKRDGVDREHVIAKCFFKPPIPGEIPKVPACKQCNQFNGDGGSGNLNVDEPYVRDRICMQRGVDDHPDAKWLLENKVHSNLLRSQSQRERQAIIDSLEFTLLEIEPDMYLSNVPSFKFDLQRFERVMKKIVCGLYAFHFNERLPDSFNVIILPRADQEMFATMKTAIEQDKPSVTFNLGSLATVAYKFAPSGRSPLGHNWLFAFYWRYSFAIYTGPGTSPSTQTNAGVQVPFRPFPVNCDFRFD